MELLGRQALDRPRAVRPACRFHSATRRAADFKELSPVVAHTARALPPIYPGGGGGGLSKVAERLRATRQGWGWVPESGQGVNEWMSEVGSV
jgi:hypothetical protein